MEDFVHAAAALKLTDVKAVFVLVVIALQMLGAVRQIVNPDGSVSVLHNYRLTVVLGTLTCEL